jgi:signal peptidase I
MAATTSEETRTGRSRALGCAVELIQTVVLTVAIFLGLQTFVAQPFRIEQHSMEQTFDDGQYVLVDRLSHLWSPYRRGQVVVFQPPEGVRDHKEPFIKRVIGLPGDTVEVRDDGQVYVNEVELAEPYLFRDSAGVAEPTTASDEARWRVPDGDVFVMGDHRQASIDSRIFGPIPISSVIGRAVLRYWPLSTLSIVETPTYGP